MPDQTPQRQTKATDINLLPSIMKPQKYALSLSSTLKKIIVVGLSVFIVAATVAVGTFFLLTNRLNASNARKQELVSEIKALEQTEQRFILIKDRLSKINTVLTESSTTEEIDTLSNTLNKLPQEAVFQGAELGENDLVLFLNTPNSFYLARLFAVLVGSGSYKKIELNSLSYEPETGYELELTLAE